jgi:NAD(P)-dependent dehydrogenase (short-subunit alcohol dehydrogenase family)
MDSVPGEYQGMKNFPREDIILIAGESSRVKTSLVNALIQDHFKVKQIVWGNTTAKNGHDQFLVSPFEDVDRLAGILCAPGEKVGAVIGLGNSGKGKGDTGEASRMVFGFFNLLKAFEKNLRVSAARGGGKVFSITFLGGGFGVKASHAILPETAGLLGITKTAALEWPDVTCRCIDIDPKMGVERIAIQLWKEMNASGGILETGILPEGRCRMVLEEHPGIFRKPALSSSSVLLFLGGASGITAEIAKETAKRYRPVMVLAGRSPWPAPESAETRDIQSEADLRSFFIRSAKTGAESLTPAEINLRIQQLLKQRRLTANVTAMKETGATVEYHGLDLKKASGLSSLLDDLYSRFGRIDGVVHGAGVVEDRLIRDKSMDSFRKVYDAKVIPAKVLTEKLKPEFLKFLVFFSSITARFGNPGQCDYSAANEVLNKLAHDLSRKWAGTRVVSMGWGPWEAGMVSEDLKRFYRKNGIGLIPVNCGIEMFFNEIGMGVHGPPEVVVARDFTQIAEKGLGQVFS